MLLSRHLARVCDPRAKPGGASPPEAWLQLILTGTAKEIFIRERKTYKNPIRQTRTRTRTLPLSNALCAFAGLGRT